MYEHLKEAILKYAPLSKYPKFLSLAAPAADVSLIYTKPDAYTVNLTCSVEGVYPEPEVELSWGPR